MSNTTITERLKEAKDARDFSLEKIARDLGVSWRTVQRWVSGDTVPTGLYAEKLERWLRKQEREA
jgi:ribosome-binding protein aMBF1 (putative translation factor)